MILIGSVILYITDHMTMPPRPAPPLPAPPPSLPDLPPKDTLPLNTQRGGIYWEQNVGITSIKYPPLPIFSGNPNKYPSLLIVIFDVFFYLSL